MKPGEIVKLNESIESIPIWTEQYGLDKRNKWIRTPRKPEIVCYLKRGNVALVIDLDVTTGQALILIPPGQTGWILDDALVGLR